MNWSKVVIRQVLSKLSEEAAKLPISVCIMMEKLGEYMQEQMPHSPGCADRLILQVISLLIGCATRAFTADWLNGCDCTD